MSISISVVRRALVLWRFYIVCLVPISNQTPNLSFNSISVLNFSMTKEIRRHMRPTSLIDLQLPPRRGSLSYLIFISKTRLIVYLRCQSFKNTFTSDILIIVKLYALFYITTVLSLHKAIGRKEFGVTVSWLQTLAAISQTSFVSTCLLPQRQHAHSA